MNTTKMTCTGCLIPNDSLHSDDEEKLVEMVWEPNNNQVFDEQKYEDCPQTQDEETVWEPIINQEETQLSPSQFNLDEQKLEETYCSQDLESSDEQKDALHLEDTYYSEDEVWEPEEATNEEETTCIGCLHNILNQEGHMDKGGCLYEDDEKETLQDDEKTYCLQTQDEETDWEQDLATNEEHHNEQELQSDDEEKLVEMVWIPDQNSCNGEEANEEETGSVDVSDKLNEEIGQCADTSCIGCLNDILNQEGHMQKGGCLYVDPVKYTGKGCIGCFNNVLRREAHKHEGGCLYEVTLKVKKLIKQELDNLNNLKGDLLEQLKSIEKEIKQLNLELIN